MGLTLHEQTLRKGRPASPGLAGGPVSLLVGQAKARRASGDAVCEAADLRAAIAAALSDVRALMRRTDAEGAEILAFQEAIIEDEALSDPAFAAIGGGAAADRAWIMALDTEIAGYLASDDEYFRARSADLLDVKDRVLRHLRGESDAAAPAGAVLLGDDLTPSRFLSTDWSAGGAVALLAGSASSHVAMLARARGVPMVVGLGAMPPNPPLIVLVDGARGEVVFDPDAQTMRHFEARQSAARAAEARDAALAFLPARTATGEAVQVLINVADPAELDGLDPALCDGIGLVRTEFLFHGAALPDEDRQTAVYERIARWAAGRPVTLRTLDAGGDKPIPGLTIDGETNPFLGVRGLRLSLARPDVFLVQLRALCRAAVIGNLKIMLPMVTVARELAQARGLLDQALAELSAEGVPHRRPALGIMVEVPAAALNAVHLAADFYSIGSNDLTQYTMAAARDIGAVADLNDASDPAVLTLISMTVAAARSRAVDVSLCGDAAADPGHVPALLASGLRILSVAPVAVARVKAAVAQWPARS